MKTKKAFSVTETIILLTVLAVAIAASIPVVTKKIINVSDAGSTITGASHGRYEIFTKEIISTPDDKHYEKTTKPPESPNKVFGGGKDAEIIVFRRLHDEEFIEVTNTIPTLSKDGRHKSTIYEQINNATPIRNSDGEIEFVEFTKKGSKKKYPIGGNIIVENANLIYKQGCLRTDTNPKEFVLNGKTFQDGTQCTSGDTILPTKQERIIEGNYTRRCYKDAIHTSLCQKFLDSDENTLWLSHVSLGADKNNDFELKDTPIPWEKIYSGKDPIIDRPIVPIDPNPDNGIPEEEYIGTFDPGDKAINIVVHAVGGGGAGGGLGDPGKAISVDKNKLTSAEINHYKHELAKDLTLRFNKARGTSFTYVPNSLNNIVGFVDDPNFGKTNFISDNDGKYIYINISNGTITGKIDVREGNYYIFPNELLNYTKVLGTATQKAQIYNMPTWGTWNTIKESDFRVGSGGCGTAGGKGGDVFIESATNSFGCKQEKYCPGGANPRQNNVSHSHCPGGWSSCAGKKNCTPQCLRWCHDITVNCYWSCDGTVYDDVESYTFCPGSGAAGFECPYEKLMGVSCIHGLLGGPGGSAPPCAVACSDPIVSQIPNVSRHCEGPDGAGAGGGPNSTVSYGSSVTATGGQKGRSCYIYAGRHSAFSEGGGGGQPCTYSGEKYDIQEANQKQLDLALSEVFMGTSSADHLNIGADGSITVDSFLEGVMDWMLETTYCIDAQYKKSSVVTSIDMLAGQQLACKTEGECGASVVCGAPGAAGVGYSSCGNTKGIDTTGESFPNIYNHIYTWTIPYSFNRLAYGEAGQAGEYKTTKIAKVEESLHIKLGKGGAWDLTKNKWKNATQGPNGTDTIVKMGETYQNAKSVLVAKGGKGGSQKQLTDKYDLCFPYDNDGLCKGEGTSETKCCNKEKGMRSTRDIISTALNISAFENIKSLVGNSLIIGTGTGRGGEGAGTRAGVEEIGRQRYFMNSSAYGLSTSERILLIDSPAKTPVDGDYDNTALNPSDHNFRGGDGAVIITW